MKMLKKPYFKGFREVLGLTLTLNQRVWGSSPQGITIEILEPLNKGFFYVFCSPTLS